MRPLFWPVGPPRALALPRLRPSRDLLLAALVAASTMTVAWTSAMVAAVVIITG